jgi:hypothetical protein
MDLRCKSIHFIPFDTAASIKQIQGERHAVLCCTRYIAYRIFYNDIPGVVFTPLSNDLLPQYSKIACDIVYFIIADDLGEVRDFPNTALLG